ncbi:MAG: right-handed parallel beta-helix repeat-containing protein, partial [Phycisphaerales bacterium]|nr:right-handed parallel beta-helix repeat-containing protein [Phycisphaerales bacterium]
MNRIAAVIAGLSLAFVGTSATFAGTINVPGDQPTIAAAISASVNGDVINIAAGTYNEANLNPDGKAITIQGTLNGDGSLATTIDAQQGGSVFVFNSGEGDGTVIKDLVITGGTGTLHEGWILGGGFIIMNGSSPTISGCTISGNTATFGGGIYCGNNGNPTIIGCEISGNAGYDAGGGIYCWDNSNATITNCTIEGNTANSGGGIYCIESSNPTISDCTIEGNTAKAGGGIFFSGSS